MQLPREAVGAGVLFGINGRRVPRVRRAGPPPEQTCSGGRTTASSLLVRTPCGPRRASDDIPEASRTGVVQRSKYNSNFWYRSRYLRPCH